MFGRKRSTVTSLSNLLLRSFTDASDSIITGPMSGYATCWMNLTPLAGQRHQHQTRLLSARHHVTVLRHYQPLLHQQTSLLLSVAPRHSPILQLSKLQADILALGESHRHRFARFERVFISEPESQSSDAGSAEQQHGRFLILGHRVHNQLLQIHVAGAETFSSDIELVSNRRTETSMWDFNSTT
ncbi:hypothetical protein INR49_002218 [Caranx melampygus]|nr:hypothetical protein INR49_002218 [Caranx melampygus]